MTRSVEIPEAGETAAFEALRAHEDASYWNSCACHCGATFETAELLHRHIANSVVAAALPYLVPAEQACSCPPHPNPEYSTPGDWNPKCPVHQPAGDGGLREALEKHAEVWSTTGGPLGVSYATRVRDLLAAHPAAPAVPQPAVLPTCPNCWSETFECSACGSLVEPLESAVPQPVDRPVLNRDAVEEAIATKAYYYDSATAVHEVDDNDLAGLTAAADAIMALAVPVDREALIKAISAASNPEGTYVTPVRTYVENWADVFADAVLALLAGEQEQVEP